MARGRLLTAEPAVLSPGEAVDALVVLQAEQARLSAREAELLVRAAGAEVQQREVVVDGGRQLVLTDEAREEIAAALRRTPGQVYDEVKVARLLSGPLRRTWEALAAGRITAAHARAVAQQAARLEPDADVKRFGVLCRELQDRVLEAAERLTVGETRSRARRVVEGIDRDAAARRRVRARRQVDVCAYAEDDGVGVLFARLPIADAARLHAAVCARAASADLVTACDGTPGQRRAAALVDLVLGSNSSTAGAVATAVEVQADRRPGHPPRARRPTGHGRVRVVDPRADRDGGAPRPAGRPRDRRDAAAAGPRSGDRAAAGPGSAGVRDPGRAAVVHCDPGRGMPVPWLPAPRPFLPGGPCERVGRRWADRCGEPRLAVRAAPPAEDPRTVADHPIRSRRLLHLDLTGRPGVPPRTRLPRPRPRR